MARILAIDDDKGILNLLRLVLEDKGHHEVTVCSDAADGLDQALSSPPDLTIVDVMMPRINGYEIVRKLRENPQTANIPILILTARRQMVDRQAALDAGADDYMAKPMSPQALLDKVEELLESSRAKTARGGAKVVSLLSLRGGVGVTTLAVNLALNGVRQRQAGKKAPKVCLVDLCPSSGQATLHLRVKAQKTWAALPALGEDPSSAALAALLTGHPSGLQLLAAPFEPTCGGALSPALIESMLNGLGRVFDLVVIDAPPLIDVVAASALDGSDKIVLVLAPEVGSIQATVATLQVLGEMQDRVVLVLNQIAPQGGVPEATIEKALGCSLALTIPHDPAQAAALPQGKPLAWAQPSSPLAVATGELLALVSQ